LAGQLSLFGSKRQRGKAPPTPLEDKLHKQAFQVWRRWKHPEWKMFHVPNGGRRDIITRVEMNRKGVMAGVPDFVLLGPNRQTFFIELKRKGGQLSKTQVEFKAWCLRYGFPHAVCDNLEDVVAHLQHWGALRTVLKVQ
jgi:hypothetical protein